MNSHKTPAALVISYAYPHRFPIITVITVKLITVYRSLLYNELYVNRPGVDFSITGTVQ